VLWGTNPPTPERHLGSRAGERIEGDTRCDLRSSFYKSLASKLGCISNGHLEGMLSRTQLFAYLQTHAELGR
jgi:hypothetical protein